MKLSFEGKLWRWQGEAPAAWHFITLPEETAGQIKFITGKRKGFGSIRVAASIADAKWKTSLFPDKKTGSFLLPVKADVRKAAKISDGDLCTVTIALDV